MNFSSECLRLDCESEVARITRFIRQVLGRSLRKKGLVVALSGGIDSSLTAALCVRAVGPERVFGLLLPERDSEPEALQFGRQVAEQLRMATQTIDITDSLRELGCYDLRDSAIRALIPEYGPGARAKIALAPTWIGTRHLNYFVLTVQLSATDVRHQRLPVESMRQIVAGTNMKQRLRKLLEYTHADRLQYAVAGTANRLEHVLGFFVRQGDGMADIKPIAHLYKTQVYQLSRYLNLPQSVVERVPTTDTYSLAQTQEEFFFGLALEKLDIVLHGLTQAIPIDELAVAVDLDTWQLQNIIDDLNQKRRSTQPLHADAFMLSDADNVDMSFMVGSAP